MNEEHVLRLVHRMVDGDHQAYTDFYHETKQEIYRMCYLMLMNETDTLEVSANVYEQIWKSISRFDRERSFRAWLHGLIARQVSHYRRSMWRSLRLFEKQKQYVSEDMIEEQSDLIQKESRSELWKQIQGLSTKLRAVIVLRYLKGYSFEEIANFLEIPLGTVKSRHSAALEKLRTSPILQMYFQEVSTR